MPPIHLPQLVLTHGQFVRNLIDSETRFIQATNSDTQNHLVIEIRNRTSESRRGSRSRIQDRLRELGMSEDCLYAAINMVTIHDNPPPVLQKANGRELLAMANAIQQLANGRREDIPQGIWNAALHANNQPMLFVSALLQFVRQR